MSIFDNIFLRTVGWTCQENSWLQAAGLWWEKGDMNLSDIYVHPHSFLEGSARGYFSFRGVCDKLSIRRIFDESPNCPSLVGGWPENQEGSFVDFCNGSHDSAIRIPPWHSNLNLRFSSKQQAESSKCHALTLFFVMWKHETSIINH